MRKSPRLTNREREVLKKIVRDGRISDTDISKSLPVSQQAVYQMRNRLEDMGIIKGYVPIIDFNKIGITMFHFVGIQIMPSLWKKFSEFEINKKLCEIPFLFMAFRIPSSEISYMLILGFKNIEEEELFTKKLETTLADELKIVWSYTSSVNNMLAYDSLNVVFHALEQDEIDVKDTVENITKK
jgi:DNA-binding Lrp family transcriptional regulator